MLHSVCFNWKVFGFEAFLFYPTAVSIFVFLLSNRWWWRWGLRFSCWNGNHFLFKHLFPSVYWREQEEGEFHSVLGESRQLAWLCSSGLCYSRVIERLLHVKTNDRDQRSHCSSACWSVTGNTPASGEVAGQLHVRKKSSACDQKIFYSFVPEEYWVCTRGGNYF